MTDPEITIEPSPATQNDSVTISYTGTNPQTLSIEWVPDGAGPATVTTDANGTVTITVPSNATAMLVTGGGAIAVGNAINEG